MSPSTFRRKIIVLVLGFALVASAAAATDLRSPAWPGPLQLLSQGTQGLLVRLASLVGTFWEKEGGSLDPYGVPGNGQGNGSPQGVSGDNGCGIDPYGLCVNGQSTGDNGDSLDPYGL